MKKRFNCRRRKIGSVRFEVNLDVQFSGQNPEGREFEGIGVIRNLAMCGALIETYAQVKADDQLNLFLTLPNRAEFLEIPAVAVRWVRGHQVGVEFLKVDAETVRQLMKYLSGIHIAAQGQSETA